MDLAEKLQQAKHELARIRADLDRIRTTLRGVEIAYERQVGRVEVLAELRQEAGQAEGAEA